MAADIALVSMPFGPVFAPSLGLSLLQAELADEHLAARIHYFSIRFAESIGQALYTGIADGDRPVPQDLAGEWLFTKALFDTTDDDTHYVEALLEGYYSDALIARLLRARARVDTFLDECLDVLLHGGTRVVGFTSIFQQHTASLALARRLKQASPSTFIVFGGANCEAIMGAETVRSFPFVDAAVSGEADLVFPELVRRALDGAPVADLPGVRSRDRVEQDFAEGVFGNAPVVRDMDRLPLPDYRDYFEQFKASRYYRGWQPSILLETSRGCWWGARSQCTFCGLNAASMSFRSKSPARALREVTGVARRHPGCDIHAVDNILDIRYFKEFLPTLAARRRKISVFYETKANLKKDQIRQLRNAGIVTIQPGIESLSDPVLKLMRKGVTALQNVQLLKWCKELGVQPTWNVIWGFPGEPAAEYERLARLIPLLTHLPAPFASARIRLDRFSPNFVEADRIGFADVRPAAAFKHVYRLSDRAVANLARHFSYGYAAQQDVERYTRRLARQLKGWQHAAAGTDLLYADADDCLVIVDMRPISRTPFRVLTGLARLLYRECDAVRDVSQLSRAVAAASPPPASDAIERTLSHLVDEGLVLRDGSRYVALAISLGEYRPPPATNRRFAALVRKHGQPDDDGWVVPTGSPQYRTAGRRTRRGRVPQLATARFSVDPQEHIVIRAEDANTVQRRTDGKEEGRQKEGWGSTAG